MSDLDPDGRTIALPLMSAEEARAAVEQIKAGFAGLRVQLLDLHEREGWRALGYESWRECVVGEFAGGQARLYQQLNAAEIERRIVAAAAPKSVEADSFSTNVETPTVPIPEWHLRPLSRLQPRQQASAWAEAVRTAPEGKLTAKHVDAVVEKRLSGPIPKPGGVKAWASGGPGDGQAYLPGFELITDTARQPLRGAEWVAAFLRSATPDRAMQLDATIDDAFRWLADVKDAWDELREQRNGV